MVGVTGTRYVSVLRFVCGVQLMLVNIRCLCQGRSNRTALRTQSWGLMSEIEALTVQFKVLGKSLGFPQPAIIWSDLFVLVSCLDSWISIGAPIGSC